MWSVSADRSRWELSGAGEFEIIQALFELMTEHKGTVRVEASAGGSELTLTFFLAAQWPMRIHPPVRYSLGDMSLQTGQTLNWEQKLRLRGRSSISAAAASGSFEQAIDMLFLRPGRAFE